MHIHYLFHFLSVSLDKVWTADIEQTIIKKPLFFVDRSVFLDG